MKALTVWQPWASLLAIGAKKFETRSWATSYRGPIAIHAAKRPVEPLDYAIFNPPFARAMQEALTAANMSIHRLPSGAIVATAELVGCWKIDSIQEFRSAPWEPGYWDDRMNWYDVSDQEIMFGDWTPGRYAWELANVQMLPEPIPAKGQQGLWNWEAA